MEKTRSLYQRLECWYYALSPARPQQCTLSGADEGGCERRQPKTPPCGHGMKRAGARGN